ncbi:hypothetical protein F946_01139 [Acinetobacter johnsonii ANC 3681]|uniref:ATPase AAA-type core domain-containing protein n=1 Tax=Acinetobacter johnsonii ANC 3681 TaxID=1217662 RepID=N9CRU5_ACIJO|nr:hypothetical protein [Acinetobacter johnsonii]ENV73249.1 hypothetical protein F946_01139 [Acinetobacter johnsonii ANC 3681]
MNVFYSEDISSALRGIIVAKDNYRTGHSSPWDDFDYKVKFKIYFKDEKTEILLGHIRILKNHQKNTANFFKEKGTKIDNKNYEITDLFNDNEIISLPLNLSFYKKLKSIFNSEDENIIDFLTSIRDGSTFISEENIFSKFSGYNDTLLREGSTSEAILKKGYQVALGRYADIKTISLDININHEKFDTFNLNFDKNRKYGERNINLLIGRNGSGKTYILNNIINSILNINNSKISYPYFNKIIIAAFSPFEKFLTQHDISNIYINEIKNKK